jgi:hypothetical protein
MAPRMGKEVWAQFSSLPFSLVVCFVIKLRHVRAMLRLSRGHAANPTNVGDTFVSSAMAA